MKLLVVSQYFWPESFIINQIAETLVSQGHQVTVLTGKPNYPDGEIYSGYSVWGIEREQLDSDIDVIRVPLRPRHQGRGRDLFFNYLSFLVTGLLCFPWLVRGKKFDAILVFAPSPIMAAIPAIPLKWIKHCPLSIWVQDLWPESLSATGFVKNSQLLSLIGFIVKAIYKGADQLLVQSRAFIEPVSRYADPDKIHYFPNSIQDDELVQQQDGQGQLPGNLLEMLEQRFCFVFAGNLGHAQSLETILEAARLLQDMKDIQVVLVGSGSRQSWVESQVQKLALHNVMLAGRFEMSQMPMIYNRAQALLVTLRDEAIFSYTIPSKIQAYLCAGRPIVCAVNGEGAHTVEQSKSGLTVPAANATALAEAMRSLYKMPVEQRAEMGRRGRQYFLENFEMNTLCQQLVPVLQLQDELREMSR